MKIEERVVVLFLLDLLINHYFYVSLTCKQNYKHKHIEL